MNKPHTLAALLLLGALLASCEDSILLAALKDRVSTKLPWSRTFGGPNTDAAAGLFIKGDKSLVLAGRSGINVALLGLTPSGTLSWAKTYSVPLLSSTTALAQTADGGSIVVGSSTANGYDLWAVRLDASGNQVWAKGYGTANFDIVHSVLVLSDETFLLSGGTSIPADSKDDVWLLHLASDGSVAPFLPYGGAYNGITSHGFGLTTASEKVWASAQWPSGGGYIFAGESDSKGLLMSLQFNRRLEFAKTYDLTNDMDQFIGVCATSDGGCVAVGTTGNYGAKPDGWVLRADSTGAVLWSRTIGTVASYDQLWSVIVTQDGGFLAVGDTTPSGFMGGNTDAWAVKLSSSGAVEWQKKFGGEGAVDETRSVRESDSGYVIVGDSEAGGAGGYDAWVVQLAKDGQTISTSAGFRFGQDTGYPVTSNSVTVASVGLSAAPGTVVSVTPTTLAGVVTAPWNPLVHQQLGGD